MRKHATSWMIKVVLILVALSFVAWGGYRIREQSLIRVGSVNGEPITIEEYKQFYTSIMESRANACGLDIIINFDDINCVIKLKKKEKTLLAEQRKAGKGKKRETLEKRCRILHAQRKKGLKALKKIQQK